MSRQCLLRLVSAVQDMLWAAAFGVGVGPAAEEKPAFREAFMAEFVRRVRNGECPACPGERQLSDPTMAGWRTCPATGREFNADARPESVLGR